MNAVLAAPPLPCILKPPVLLRIVVFSITARAFAVPTKLIPFCVKFRMEHLQ